MSQAEALLTQAARNGTYTASPETEPHIVIGPDRVIAVPDELKRLAVQYDHNIETVTFDCPRYWDGIDMFTMNIYINLERRDGAKTLIQVENTAVDANDETMMHFEWTITKFVSAIDGGLKFNVCIKSIDDDGIEVEHWNSELCKDCYISKGLEGDSVADSSYPDIINYLSMRMDEILGSGLTVNVSMEKVNNELVVRIVAPDRTEEFRLVDGETPYIGENGNWWIGDIDTGAVVSPPIENFMDMSVYDPDGRELDIFKYVHDNGVPEADRSRWNSRMSTDVYDPQGKKTDMFQYVHDNAVSSENRTKWDNKSNFSGEYDDLRNKPTIPEPIVVVDSVSDDSTDKAASAAAVKQAYTLAKNAMVGTIMSGVGSFEIYDGGSNSDKIWSIGAVTDDPVTVDWYSIGHLIFIHIRANFYGRYPDNAYCKLTGITPLKRTDSENPACLTSSLIGCVEHGSSGIVLYGDASIGAECRCDADGELIVHFGANASSSNTSFRWILEGCLVGLCDNIT